MNPTHARDSAARLAPSDWHSALVLAKKAADPWYRCQALAWVARYAPSSEVGKLVAESVRAAEKAADLYRATACVAWSVRALVERGFAEQAAALAATTMARAESIPEPASRSESMFLLLQAIFPAGRKFWRPVFDACIRVSASGVHWRQRRNLREAVLMAGAADLELARSIVPTIRDRRLRERLERDLADRRFQSPRPFFWARNEQG